MPPKPPAQPKPERSSNVVLLEAEQDAINQAQQVKDSESQQYKVIEDKQLAMRKELRQLKKVSQQQQKLLNYFQQQRQKISYNWIIAKKQYQDRKSEHINKQRQIEDLRQNHIMTLNVYKQKQHIVNRIKHLLFQNQDQQTDVIKDVEITLKQLEDQHRVKERQLKTDVRALHVSLKEQQLSQQDYTFALKSQFDKRCTQLRQQFQRQAGQLKKKYDLKMHKIRTQMQQARTSTIRRLQQKKDEKIKKLTNQHTKKYADIKSYYSDITATNLDLIKQLRTEINERKKKEDDDRKTLRAIQNQKRNLLQPSKRLQMQIKKLEQDEQKQKYIIMMKKQQKAKIDQNQKQFRDLQYQYEVKLQSLKYLKNQKDKLHDIYNTSVFEIHQKTGLSNLILQKKVNTIQDDLQVKDLQLNQVLVATNIDPRAINAINNSLQQVQALKSMQINELQNKLQQIRKAHSHMVKDYQSKLTQFVIPVQQLGFDPLVPTNTQ